MAEAIRIDILEERIEAPAPLEYQMAWHRFLRAWAACMIIAAVLLARSARRLRARRRCGLTLLKWGWLLSAGAGAAHMLARFAISGLPPLNLSELAQLLTQLLLARICTVYYRRRPGALD